MRLSKIRWTPGLSWYARHRNSANVIFMIWKTMQRPSYMTGLAGPRKTWVAQMQVIQASLDKIPLWSVFRCRLLDARKIWMTNLLLQCHHRQHHDISLNHIKDIALCPSFYFHLMPSRSQINWIRFYLVSGKSYLWYKMFQNNAFSIWSISI